MPDAPADDDGWLLAGPTSPDHVRDYYDGWAGEYDEALRSWGYDAPERGAQLLLDAFRAGGAPLVGTTVLDAGCGTGLTGAALRAAGFDGVLIGLDLSRASLDLAAERTVYDELHVTNLQEPLAYGDGAVGALLCVAVSGT
jgi:predicted TPR repeat methyltransferase